MWAGIVRGLLGHGTFRKINNNRSRRYFDERCNNRRNGGRAEERSVENPVHQSCQSFFTQSREITPRQSRNFHRNFQEHRNENPILIRTVVLNLWSSPGLDDHEAQCPLYIHQSNDAT